MRIWISSIIFLGLGIFAGTRLNSKTTPVQGGTPALPISISTQAPETEPPARRGPASISQSAIQPVQTLATPSEGQNSPSDDEIYSALTNPRLVHKWEEVAASARFNWQKTFLWSNFVMDVDPYLDQRKREDLRSATNAKLRDIALKSNFWKAEVTTTIEGRNAHITAWIQAEKIEGPRFEGEMFSQLIIQFQLEGQTITFQATVTSFAERKGRYYQEFDVPRSRRLASLISYFMVSLPQEEGQIYFLGTSSFKWSSSAKLIWKPVSEEEFSSFVKSYSEN